MFLQLETKFHVELPELNNYSCPNLWIFSLCHSTAQIANAFSKTLAQFTDRGHLNLQELLNKQRIKRKNPDQLVLDGSIITNYNAVLHTLLDLSGFAISGTTPLPEEFASSFRSNTLTGLFVRDPRDIGILEYHRKYRSAKADILTNETNDVCLDDFLVDNTTIDWIKKESFKYRKIIKQSAVVFRIEDSSRDAKQLSIKHLTPFLWYNYVKYIRPETQYSQFADFFEDCLINEYNFSSQSLDISLYTKLPRKIRREYTEELLGPLKLFGYL